MNPDTATSPLKAPSLAVPTLWLMLAKTVAFGLSFVLPLLLARQLDQTDYGLYKQTFLLVATAVSILPLGFHGSAFYFMPREADRKGQVACNILVFHALAAVLGCLVLASQPALLAAIFNSPDLIGYAPLIALVVLLWVMASPLQDIAIANQETKLAATLIIVIQVVSTLLFLCAAIVFGSLHALISAAVVAGFLQMIVLLAYLAKRGAFARRFDWSLMRSQTAYALPLGAVGLLWTMQLQVHHYFVSNRFDAATYAIYAIGCFELPLIAILSDSIGSVLKARVSLLQKHNERREIIAVTARMMRQLAAVCLPAYAFLLIAGPEFIETLFTTAYLESWPIFAVNLTLIPLCIVASACDPIMRAYPQHRFFLLGARVAMVLLLLVALWFGTDRFGLIGVITVVVLVNLIERVVTGIKAASIVGASWRDAVLLRDVGKLAVAAMAAGAVTAVVRSVLVGAAPWTVLAACGLVFLLVYLFAGLLLGVLTHDERELIRSRIAWLRRVAFEIGTGGVSLRRNWGAGVSHPRA